MGTLLTAADFVAPAEGPVAFRRDKVPLDSDTMGSLSKQLGSLVGGLDITTAAGRRTAAQMLALATALDPSNLAARELISSLQNGTPPPIPDPAAVEKYQMKIWQYISWLETPEAGDQGKALAACLADVIAVSDPGNPRAGAIRTAGERGAWTGWIPPVSAYETKALTKIEIPEPDAGTTPPKAPEIFLKKAEVHTPIWRREGKDVPKEFGNNVPKKWVLSSSLLRMTAAQDSENKEDFTVIIRAAPDGGSLEGLGTTIHNLLKKQHSLLPAGLKVTITSDELQKSALSGKRQSISGAAAVLASAAVTGQEPDATIIGIVDEKGTFKLPTGFWEQLDSLDRGNGGRLVLPAAAAEYLPSILAFERAQFFLDYEVVLASNFQELLDLSAKNPNESIAKVSAKFQEIRSKAGTQAASQYVANSFIRRRLADLAQEAPYHFSARMLAIQGVGNRPTQVPRVVLIPELRRAIEPVAWLVNPDESFEGHVENNKIEKITQTFEACRSQVDRLDRYVMKEDRDLFGRVKEVVSDIRSIERAARSRGEDYVVRESVVSARKVLVDAHQGISEALAESGGESASVTVPAH